MFKVFLFLLMLIEMTQTVSQAAMSGYIVLFLLILFIRVPSSLVIEFQT